MGSSKVETAEIVLIEICFCYRFLQYKGNNWRTGKAIVVLVDFGNMFEIKVTEIRATIYAERLPVLAHRAVVHNLVPAGNSA